MLLLGHYWPQYTPGWLLIVHVLRVHAALPCLQALSRSTGDSKYHLQAQDLADSLRGPLTDIHGPKGS